MKIFRGVNWIMCALFLLSVVVQWNDPDAARWMAIYGAAFAVCLAIGLRARVPAMAPLLVAVIALAWAIAIIDGGRTTGYSHMFDAWEMKSANVELAREATGLLIAGVWMLVIAVAQRYGAGETSMKRLVFLLLMLIAAAGVSAQRPLEIYVIDPEGGKAALWIAPSGETVLIDSGNPGARDLDRLKEVFAATGVKRIDYLISTHYHVDHIGGLQELVKNIPVGTFIDHGPTVEGPVVPSLREQVPGFQAAYAELWKGAKHLVVKPGDVVPVKGLDWRIVTSAGAGLKAPLAGAPGAGGPNPACAGTPPKNITEDPDNGQSVGSVITLGRFRAADFGDLLWDNELALMCPNNPIGTVDLFMVTHHGQSNSNSPPMVHGLRPRAAIMQNGTNKGAAVDAMKVLRSSPGLEDIWQLHWSYTAGIEHNAPGVFIANLEEPATLAQRLTAPPGSPRPAPGPPHVPAYWIKVTADASGSFTITNSRNNVSKTYNPR